MLGLQHDVHWENLGTSNLGSGILTVVTREIVGPYSLIGQVRSESDVVLSIRDTTQSQAVPPCPCLPCSEKVMILIGQEQSGPRNKRHLRSWSMHR